MDKYIIRHGAYTWGGRTKREAEQKRDADLADLLGSYDNRLPNVVLSRGRCLVVYQDGPFNWAYRIDETRLLRSDSRTIGYGSRTREAAERAGRLQLAQTLWSTGDDTSDLVEHPGDAQSFASWAKFQRAYAEAVRLNPSWSIHELHHAACQVADAD